MNNSSTSVWNRVVGGVFWTLTSSWGGQLVNLAVTLVLARLLGPREFGTVTGAYVIAMACAAFIDLGCTDPLIRAKGKRETHFHTMFWVFLGSSACIGVLLVAFSSALTAAIGQPELLGPMIVFAITLPVTGTTSLLTAKLRSEMQFRTLAVRNLAAAACGGALGIGMALLGFGFWSLVVRILCEGLVGVVLLFAFGGYRPKFQFSAQVFFELFDQGRHLLIRNVLDVINTRADSLIIGARLGPAQLGEYTAAQRLHLAIVDTVSSVSGVLLPAFGKMQDDPDRIENAYLRVLRMVATLVFPLFLLLAALSEPFVLFLLGGKWLNASPVVGVLAFGGVLLTVNWINSTIMIAVGRADFQFRLAMLNSPLNLAACLVGSHWGPVGVACGLVIRTYILFPLSITWLRTATGIHRTKVIAEVAPPFFIALTIAAGIHVCDRILSPHVSVALRLFGGGAIGLIAYGVATAVFLRKTVLAILGDLALMLPRLQRPLERIRQALHH